MPPKPLHCYAVLPTIGPPTRPRTTSFPTDPVADRRNPNARFKTDTETIPGPQADIERPVNNNVPETPSQFAAIGLGQMVLASPDEAPPLGRLLALRERLNRYPDDRFAGNDQIGREEMYPPSRIQGDVGLIPSRNTSAVTPVVPAPRSLIHNAANRPINAVNRFDENETNDRERTNPPPRIEGDVGLTPTRNTRAVAPLVQTPASRMPPPQTPASRIKVPSPASRLLRSTSPSPLYIVRSMGTHNDEVDVTPGVVRVLFPRQGTNLASTPEANPNTSEHQLVHPQTGHDPLRQSRLRSLSFTSALDEGTEMASPNVARAERPSGEAHVTTPQNQNEEPTAITPEDQTGGSPPIPHTPHTPRIWISPSQVTPDIIARMATPVYRNRDERMEMTPSPPKLKPASPDDRKMEDAFWTPNKPGASLDLTGFRKKVADAQNPTPMEYKSPIVSSAPFGDGMAQGIAPIQNVAPIGNPAPVQDAMSPGTTTVRTVISTEITTTISETPSPLQSPTPARRTTDNRRPIAAKPHKTSDAPRREVASTPQRRGNGGAGKNTNRRRTAEHIIPGGINRRQELRTSPRYSLRDSTRGITPGTYSMTPVRNRPFKVESPSKKN